PIAIGEESIGEGKKRGNEGEEEKLYSPPLSSDLSPLQSSLLPLPSSVLRSLRPTRVFGTLGSRPGGRCSVERRAFVSLVGGGNSELEGFREMTRLEKTASIDAQLRLLAPGKVSEDDKLVEYDALLLDRFLDILQDLHGEDLREMVIERHARLLRGNLSFPCFCFFLMS
ncbi:hypothetical protein GW17_00043004, partial [Ensete ventricosum]